MRSIGVSELVAGMKFEAAYAGEEKRLQVLAIYPNGEIGTLPEGVADTGQEYDTYNLNDVAEVKCDGQDFDWQGEPQENLFGSEVTLKWAADTVGGTVISVDDSTVVFEDGNGDECELPLATLSDVEVEEDAAAATEADGEDGKDAAGGPAAGGRAEGGEDGASDETRA